jgi:hypothetical protein
MKQSSVCRNFKKRLQIGGMSQMVEAADKLWTVFERRGGGTPRFNQTHNPKDPGMQQIRQLLNSGYKQGMPAIRVTGDDLKPQAFDVYSPKILVAINLC